MIELSTLGSLSLRGHDGAPIDPVVVQPKRLALLVYLVVEEPRGLHRRETLLGLFWPGQDAKHARAALRQALHGLRGAVGREVLISRGDAEVGVDPGALWCDVWAFEDAIKNRDRDQAASLYRGTFLSDFHLSGCRDFERWLEKERNGLSRHYQRVLEELADAADARGDAAQAVEYLERLAECDPHSARVVVRLMRTLNRGGDRARALQCAEQHANLLRGELNAAPNPAVVRLAERLRMQPGVDRGELLI